MEIEKSNNFETQSKGISNKTVSLFTDNGDLDISLAKVYTTNTKEFFNHYSVPRDEIIRMLCIYTNLIPRFELSKDEIMYIVKNSYNAITQLYIKNSERMNIIHDTHSVMKLNSNIENIRHPVDKLCLYVIDKNPSNLEYILKNKYLQDDVRELSIKEAIKRDGNQIFKIENQTEELRLLAINTAPESFKYCINPSEYVVSMALSKDINNFQYLKQPTEDQFLVALNKGYCTRSKNIEPLIKKNSELRNHLKFNIRYIQYKGLSETEIYSKDLYPMTNSLGVKAPWAGL